MTSSPPVSSIVSWADQLNFREYAPIIVKEGFTKAIISNVNVPGQGETTVADSKRAYTRIFFDAETVVTQGDAFWVVQLVDISLHGLLVELGPEQTPDPELALDVSIHLGGDIQICMTARIVNQRENQIGLVFEFIDVDSITHLRRLVELNTGDTSLLERELHLLL
jgi:hypothetical protein